MSRDQRQQRAVEPGDTLTAKDLFAYFIRLDRPAYVYVLEFFDGDSHLLSPVGKPPRFAAGRELRIPMEGVAWFELNDCPGEEHFYVIVSAQPLEPSAKGLGAIVQNAKSSPPRQRCSRGTIRRAPSHAAQLRAIEEEDLRAKGTRTVTASQGGIRSYQGTTGPDGVGVLEFVIVHR